MLDRNRALPYRYRKPLLVIAALQIVVGLYSLFVAFVRIPGWDLNDTSILLAFLLVCYFALSVFAGYELWQMKRRGGTLSVVVQALQVPFIISPPLVWKLVLGPQFIVDFQFWCNSKPFDLHFEIGIGSTWLAWQSGVDCWSMGVNLIAVVTVWLLYRALESPTPPEGALEGKAPGVAV